MPWARIDDAFDDHPKVLAVLEHEDGGAAIGLWTLCLTWAHRNTLRRGKTPGVVPASLPRRYLGPGARALAGLLVKEGLWDAQAEGDGWTIHDFDQYLPTEKTSAARAEAGRKGAAKRWSANRGDGKEPGTDGNLPSGQGNGPSGGHDADSNAEANDGSRAHARRAISKEIASRVPNPVPPTAGAEDRRADAAQGLTITQRSKRITDDYAQAEPMCKWPAVNGVVIKAIKAERFADEEIRDALLRMAAENRSVTVDSLRTELAGLPASRPASNGAGKQTNFTDEEYTRGWK